MLCQQEFWGSVKNSIKNIVALWGLVQDIVTALYTRLCFLLIVESPPPRLLHSWNHPFHHFPCRNDTTEIYLVFVKYYKCFSFLQIELFLHQHLPGLPDTKESTFSWLFKTVGVKRRGCLFLVRASGAFFFLTEITTFHGHFTIISYQIYSNKRLSF